jgi:hypothetical protein
MGEMNKSVACHNIDTKDKDVVWIHQPKILQNLKAKLNDLVEESTSVFNRSKDFNYAS